MSKTKYYILATLMWLFVFPITGIIGISFIASGVIAVIAGILRFILNIFGITFGCINILDYKFGSFAELLISIAVGLIIFFVGNMFWKITKQLFHWVQSTKPNKNLD